MRWIAAILAVLALMASCGTDTRSRADDGAADFSFTTFEDDEFAAAEQRGTPVVLNFWESW